jgi:predicted RNA-binding protein YlqC (UPF0109 family)
LCEFTPLGKTRAEKKILKGGKTAWVLKEVAVKELIELIAKSLVDNPDRVEVFQLDGEQSSIIELKVAPEDLGKVIGKQGRTAQAIRLILGAAGMKLKRRFNLELIEKG